MRWPPTPREKRDRDGERFRWHQWFAWHPVRVTIETMLDFSLGNVELTAVTWQWVWLERVMRQGRKHFHPSRIYWTWEYKRYVPSCRR